MEQNPYEVLNVDPAPLGDEANPSNWFTVEGDLLVCGKSLVLPEICVFTGATEELAFRTCVAQFPSFQLVIVQRQCSIQYCLTRAEDKKRRRISFLTTGGMIVGLVLMLASAPTKMVVLFTIGPILMLVFSLVKFVLTVVLGLDLRISAFEAPGTYKIRGFPKPFLATLAASLRE